MDNHLLKELEQGLKEDTSSCYQCFRCTNGCPVAKEMDILPHRIIHYIGFGEWDKVLGAKAIWQCLQCEACSVRCPNSIDIAHVFRILRRLASAEGISQDNRIWVFDRIFLKNIKKHGRLYELGAILNYKLKNKETFKDAKMGIKMMIKKRMGITPHRNKDKRHIKYIFEKIENRIKIVEK
ncbi:MAG TPA: 4Fe-4S dicluster domain-containing protein [Syntrophorhabdaceae bacterium]|nr:4Fe-4S dicluster domain-containing protein [Syntrophorhabdaceae bacterium]